MPGSATSADEALVERYLEFVRVQKRLAPRTQALYSESLGRLRQFAAGQGLPLCDVQAAHVRRWVAQLHGLGHSSSGIALVLSGWRGFYAWLGREGRVSANPVLSVRPPRGAKPLPKALSVDAAVQLAEFHGTEDAAWIECRDAAMVELLYGSGLRVGELVGLDLQPSPAAKGWLDVDAAQAHVLGKGSKRRSVPLGQPALRVLREWMAWRSGHFADQAALFVGQRGTRLSAASVWQRIQRRALLAGVGMPVHPHMLRHSFASHVLQSSGDLRAVQELLGHANISTTQVYTRLDFQHLAKVYDAAHPRAKRR